MRRIITLFFAASLLASCLVRTKSSDASLSEDKKAARPPMEGAFVYMGGKDTTRFPPDKIEAMLDEFVGLRMDTLIFSGIRLIDGECKNGTFFWGKDMPDKIALILDGAAKRGIGVYLSVTSSADACNAGERILHAKKIATDADFTASELHKRYGSHPALKGWYIPDEPGTPQPTIFPFYKGMVNAIRKHSELPIVVAPYLAVTTTVLGPKAMAGLAKVFMNATKDDKGRPMIQAWQDSVGATGVDLNWDRGQGGHVEEYFREISKAIGIENTWADVEVFNCCVPPFANGTYAAASMARLNNQLWATRAEVASKRVSWLPQIHMGEVDGEHFASAPRLRAAYLALYDMSGTYHKQPSYEWLTPPSATYPDAGQELTDMKTADPKRIKHAGWVGVQGNAKFVADLGKTSKVNFVGVHVLNEPKSSVTIPSAIKLRCLDYKRAAVATHTEARGFEPADARFEYVLSNYTPLSWECRFVEVELENGPWTFMSELEMTGGI